MHGGSIKHRLGIVAQAVCWIFVSLVGFPSPSSVYGLSSTFMGVRDTTELHGVSFLSWAFVSERTPPSRVRSIMALLATLDEAEILPPEGTSQANQFIHGLIQLQSAFLKSSSPELAAYLVAAEKQWDTKSIEREAGSLAATGLSSQVLEALILYDLKHQMWEDSKIRAVLKGFNVTESDWNLIVDIANQANSVFSDQGRSMHELYDQWLVKMSGGKP